MAIKEIVFILFTIFLPLMMGAKLPVKLEVSIQALSARSTEQDAGNQENLEEKMKENIIDIQKLVKKKKLKNKNKKKILKLLDKLSEKAESCSAGSNDAGNKIKEGIEVIKLLVKDKKFAKKKEVKAKVLNLIKRLSRKAEGCGAVAGGYSTWSNWETCSETCGGGVQKRSRTCTNPPPSGGGETCLEQNFGPAEETQQCNAQDCPVHGGYTNWSEWETCSVTCGGGSQKRSRTCTNPSLSGGGQTCLQQSLGPAEETKECNAKECPCPAGWATNGVYCYCKQ